MSSRVWNDLSIWRVDVKSIGFKFNRRTQTSVVIAKGNIFEGKKAIW